MGDITVHKCIAESIMPRIPASEEPIFFEVGNFLTDVSQFRDPFAHLSGKSATWSAGRSGFKGAFLRIFWFGDWLIRLDNYLDALMSAPEPDLSNPPRSAAEGPQHGALAKWARDVIFVDARERFRHVPPADLKNVYDRFFTQYYPHEHLDFPPWPLHDAIGIRTPSAATVSAEAGAPARRMLAYLDDQLVYVADLLTTIEGEWAKKPPSESTPAERRALVARLGHASHAIEDFFFHSNFTEIAWSIAHGDPPVPADDYPCRGDAHGHEPEMGELRRRRIYYRRRRAPLGDDGDEELSTTASAPAELIYTGQFGKKDIFHTLVDALEPMFGTAPEAKPPLGEHDPRFLLKLRVHKLLFGTPAERDQALKDHRESLENGTYVNRAKAAKTLTASLPPEERLTQEDVDAIERACTLDLSLVKDFGCVQPTAPMGVVGFAQEISVKAEEETTKSHERSDEIDAEGTVADDRTDNGASGENIGSHTLMAKDSLRKEPLREETVRLATLAANYVVDRMLERMPAGGAAAPADAVDWLTVVRGLLAHPEQAVTDRRDGKRWWEASLDAAVPVPPRDALFDPLPVKAPPAPGAPSEPQRGPLELLYDQLTPQVEKEWRTTVRGDFIIDSLTTVMFSAAFVGTIVGACTARTGHEGEGALLGLLTTVFVGATGSMLSAIGFAFGDDAGKAINAIGTLIAIAGGGFASSAIVKETI